MRRHPASLALAALASVIAVSATSETADAAGKPRAKPARTTQTMPTKRQAASQPVETMDDIRANAQDPAGNYKDFPSWARAAFTNFPRD